jgi:hypothetical protein
MKGIQRMNLAERLVVTLRNKPYAVTRQKREHRSTCRFLPQSDAFPEICKDSLSGKDSLKI